MLGFQKRGKCIVVTYIHICAFFSLSDHCALPPMHVLTFHLHHVYNKKREVGYQCLNWEFVLPPRVYFTASLLIFAKVVFMNKKLNCSGIMFFAEHFKQGLVIRECLFRSFYFVAAWPQIKICPTSTSAAVAAAAVTPSIQSNITVFEPLMYYK